MTGLIVAGVIVLLTVAVFIAKWRLNKAFQKRKNEGRYKALVPNADNQGSSSARKRTARTSRTRAGPADTQTPIDGDYQLN